MMCSRLLSLVGFAIRVSCDVGIPLHRELGVAFPYPPSREAYERPLLSECVGLD